MYHWLMVTILAFQTEDVLHCFMDGVLGGFAQILRSSPFHEGFLIDTAITTRSI
jgi:hypothetical protein